MERIRPRTTDELARALTDAATSNRRLEVIGSGSRRSVGRPVVADAVLETEAFAGISRYEPEELVLTAGAATPLADIMAALEEKRQMLAFEPPDPAVLLAGPGPGTLGGMVASGLSGPRRIKAGGVRDYVLGFTAVSGRGETFKSGGRVMKNVTGYDLSKLVCGSWGTLAVLTEITIKVMPRPEIEASLVIDAGDPQSAIDIMSAALQSSADLSGAAYLPRGLAAAGVEGPVVLLRIEGIEASVEARLAMFGAVHSGAEARRLSPESSASAWRDIRDARPLGDLQGLALWRISVPPTTGSRVLEAAARIEGARAFADWGGGLAWIAVPPSGQAHGERLRASFAGDGGHATLVRAPTELRASVPVFEPQLPAMAALSRRVKHAFDPQGILNPSRLHADF